jgi:transposase
MPSSAAALLVSAGDQAVLRRWANATQAPAALVRRAWTLLLAAEGVANTEIAERLGTSRPTVIARRRRYAREGLTGQLADRPRRGRPQTVRRDRRAELLATTLARPPEHLGVTHWSTRLLAEELGCSHRTIARVWAEHNVKPWQAQTFKCSTDPRLEPRHPRRRRPVPGPARACDRGVRGREVPDPGVGAHPSPCGRSSRPPRAVHLLKRVLCVGRRFVVRAVGGSA